MTSIPAQLKRYVVNTIGHTKIVPGLYRPLDYPDVAPLTMPSALLVLNGRKDTLFASEGVRAAFDKLTACYRKAGAPEKRRITAWRSLANTLHGAPFLPFSLQAPSAGIE
jgi:hypothetical protein